MTATPGFAVGGTARAGRVPVRQADGTVQWDDTLFDAASLADPAQAVPCAVPTFDANDSCGHTSVVYIPGGWNGYRYWMAFTPYPDATRELPSIVASNDAITWEVPAGLTNPIVTSAELTGLGYNFGSDPHLVLLADGITLACYYRPFNNAGAPSAQESLYRKTSTDGITWSAGEACTLNGASSLATNGQIASPSVLLEADGTYSMWVCDVASLAGGLTNVYKRTSADGVAWSAATLCTIPAPPSGATVNFGATPYHIFVARHGSGRYFALCYDQGAANILYFLTSTDGVAWVSDSRLPIVPPLTTWSSYSNGYYRSSFVLMPGRPFTFRIMATAFSSPNGNPYNAAAQWRIVRLDARPEAGLRSLFFGQEMLRATLGSPTVAVIASRFPSYALSTGQALGAMVMFPDGWGRIRVSLLWTTTTGNSGTVNVSLTLNPTAVGAALAAGNDLPSPAPSPLPSGPTANVVVETVMGDMLPITPGSLYGFRINRTAGVNDTLTGAINVLGFLIERVG